MTTAFPLTWPPNWPRTVTPGASQFKTSLEGAINNVEKSIAAFARDSSKKVENVIVSTNFAMMDRRPKDSGVAVYFRWDGIDTCIAVDRYQKIEDNLQAVHHVLEAERVKLRHGGLNLVRAAFRGYAALPPPAAVMNWRVAFDFSPDNLALTLEMVQKRYKALAKVYHPDLPTGDRDKMYKLNAAMEAAKREFGA